jgi:hypothetical protein
MRQIRELLGSVDRRLRAGLASRSRRLLEIRQRDRDRFASKVEAGEKRSGRGAHYWPVARQRMIRVPLIG